MVEKVAFPRRKVCGEFMSGTSLRLARPVGRRRDLARGSRPRNTSRRVLFGQCLSRGANAARQDGSRRVSAADRLDYVLLQAAERAGVEILQPCKAVAIRRHDDLQFVTVETDQQQKVLSAPVIIAAHGSWEAGNSQARLKERANLPIFSGSKRILPVQHFAPDLMPLLVFPGGYGGMVTADHGRVSISCCIRRDVLSGLRQRYGNSAAADALCVTSLPVPRRKNRAGRCRIGWPMARRGTDSSRYSSWL